MKKPQKEKEQDNKSKKEQKKKLKIIIENNPLKSKINQMENTEPKKFNRNIMTHNSISTKEEIKKRLSPSKCRNKQNKLNLLSNNTFKSNKLLSSNHLFLTSEANSQANLDDKKIIKKNKKLKNYSNGGERISSKEISNAFRKDRFKKTIIIDDEGNNNLNLEIDKGDYDYKNILKNSNNTIISNSFSGNTETNSLFMSSNKSFIENYNNKNYNNRDSKENDIKQTIIDKNEEERRLIEYTKIFNLLNSNIEQFKKMFINKDINDNNSNKNKNKNKKIVIQNKKDSNNNRNNNGNNSLNKYKNNDKGKNIKKNLSEKNLSSKNKYNKNNNPSLFSPKKNKNINNNYDINNNYSFLESSIQDDFYQSLINQTFLQNVSRNSFEMNIDDISNIPDEKAICDEEKKIEEKNLKMDIKNLENKPLEEENKKKVKEKSNEKTNEGENSGKNFPNDFDKNNCFIF